MIPLFALIRMLPGRAFYTLVYLRFLATPGAVEHVELERFTAPEVRQGVWRRTIILTSPAIMRSKTVLFELIIYTLFRDPQKPGGFGLVPLAQGERFYDSLFFQFS